MKFFGRAAAHKPEITMCNCKCQLECCKTHRHRTRERGNMFSKLMNCASLSDSLMDESGFGRSQENAIDQIA